MTSTNQANNRSIIEIKYHWQHSSAFIADAIFDCLFFIGSPILALCLAYLIFRNDSPLASAYFFGVDTTVFALIAARIFTQAHIFLVIGRSHLNRNIFRQFPIRFTVVPLLLILLAFVSDIVLIALIVIGGMWDIYHSSLQTFGLARIYDAKLGNNPEIGRSLDIYLNHFLYIGAILSGINFIPSLKNIFNYRNHPLTLGEPVVTFIQSHIGLIQDFVKLSFILYLIYYLLCYMQLMRNGYRFSIQKFTLLIVTAIVSYTAWNTFPFPVALFVVNCFHALQYFAIVWYTENKNLLTLSPKFNTRWGGTLLLALLVAIPFAYGSLVIFQKGIRALFCIASVFSLMHYWYDGFIWSVRKKQVVP